LNFSNGLLSSLRHLTPSGRIRVPQLLTVAGRRPQAAQLLSARCIRTFHALCWPRLLTQLRRTNGLDSANTHSRGASTYFSPAPLIGDLSASGFPTPPAVAHSADAINAAFFHSSSIILPCTHLLTTPITCMWPFLTAAAMEPSPAHQHPVLSQTTAANHIALIVKQSRIKCLPASAIRFLYANMVLHPITPNICNCTVQHQIDAAGPTPYTFLKQSLH